MHFPISEPRRLSGSCDVFLFHALERNNGVGRKSAQIDHPQAWLKAVAACKTASVAFLSALQATDYG